MRRRLAMPPSQINDRWDDKLQTWLALILPCGGWAMFAIRSAGTSDPLPWVAVLLLIFHTRGHASTTNVCICSGDQPDRIQKMGDLMTWLTMPR